MSANRDPIYDFAAALHSRLTCPLCGSRRDCTLAALVRYSRRGWPRCCGEVMTLTSDEAAPAASSQPGEPLPTPSSKL
jgi:hypothetical protein